MRGFRGLLVGDGFSGNSAAANRQQGRPFALRSSSLAAGPT